MTDLESRLRQDLGHQAATVPVPLDPPPRLLTRVRRRRRGRLLAVAALPLALVVLLAAAVVVGGDDDTDVAAGRARTLLTSPPELSGTILANVYFTPCQPMPGQDCTGGPHRFDLRRPDALERIDTGKMSSATNVLADGRYAIREEGRPDWSILIAPGTGAPLPLGRNADSLSVLPDGRLLMLATDDDDAQRRVLRTIDPADGRREDRPAPRGTSAVTAGPGGSIAMFVPGGGCCDELIVIDSQGRQRRHRLRFPGSGTMKDRRTPIGSITMSWGASGLLAFSTLYPQPLSYNGSRRPGDPEFADPHPGWTDIVDPATGNLVASLDGWQGVAWSPDGRGLLTARRDGVRAAELAVWWGQGLRERIDAGRVSVPMAPRFWQEPG